MKEIRCPSCGYTHEQDGKIEFCPNCGSHFYSVEEAPPIGLPEQTDCPKCKTANENGALFCVKCGTSLDKTKTYCPQCHEVNDAGNDFCSKCKALINPNIKICRSCGKKLHKKDIYCSQCRTYNKSFHTSAFKAMVGIMGVFLCLFVLTVILYSREIEITPYSYYIYQRSLFSWTGIWEVFWMRIVAVVLMLILFIYSCVGFSQKCAGQRFFKTVKFAFPVLVLLHFILNIIESSIAPVFDYDNFFLVDNVMSTLNIVFNAVFTGILMLWWGVSYRSFQMIYQTKNGRK